jgi:hypothetical protein
MWALAVASGCKGVLLYVAAVRQDAASLDNPDTWTLMRDPEGNEFCLTSTSTLTGWA